MLTQPSSRGIHVQHAIHISVMGSALSVMLAIERCDRDASANEGTLTSLYKFTMALCSILARAWK